MSLLRELPPEMDAFQQEAMRDKARRNGTDGPFSERTDEWLANELRMLSRHDLYHEAFCSAARDRIMRLSMQVAELRGVVDVLKSRAAPSAEPSRP
jgi:hypothetical protein